MMCSIRDLMTYLHYLYRLYTNTARTITLCSIFLQSSEDFSPCITTSSSTTAAISCTTATCLLQYVAEAYVTEGLSCVSIVALKGYILCVITAAHTASTRIHNEVCVVVSMTVHYT
eukprot:19040-Heterococcus_DN1.PRE.1